MSLQSVFIVMRGEDHEGASIVEVFESLSAASDWVITALLPFTKTQHIKGWKAIEYLEGVAFRWECGIDFVTIETWKVRP